MAVLALASLLGCEEKPGTARGQSVGKAGPDGVAVSIYRFHDSEAGVTCWVTPYHGAISCLPDTQVQPSGRVER